MIAAEDEIRSTSQRILRLQAATLLQKWWHAICRP